MLLVVAMLVRPEIDPVHKPVSEYAIGRHGWVQVLAFLTAAVSYGCLAVAVAPAVRGRQRLGLGVLWVCAVGTAGVGLFVADPVVTPLDRLSAGGTVHVICGLSALVLLPVAAVLLGGTKAKWVPLGALVLPWGLSAVMPPEGVPPRLLFLGYACWVVTVASRIVILSAQSADMPHFGRPALESRGMTWGRWGGGSRGRSAG
ncbi:DUF998 domain-containing protein [Dactylosporangium sp. CS-047395]|uniref:DUF998 domain-containing protein n=1 Tax=Dactylosporangium sp. CS-047395 TaxID=3239936 RepID=UPI003D8ECE15